MAGGTPRRVAGSVTVTCVAGYTMEEVEGLTNKILTGPETDPEKIDALLGCVRRQEPSIQTVVNYKKGGVRFVNQVRNHERFFPRETHPFPCSITRRRTRPSGGVFDDLGRCLSGVDGAGV